MGARLKCTAFLALLAVMAHASPYSEDYAMTEDIIPEISEVDVSELAKDQSYLDNTVANLQKQFADLKDQLADGSAKTKGVRATIKTMEGLIDSAVIPAIVQAAKTDQSLLNTKMGMLQTLNGGAQINLKVLHGRAKDVRDEIKKHNQYASKWKSAATKYVKAIKGFEKLVADKNRDCCIYKKASVPAIESTPAYLDCDFKKESAKKCIADAVSALKSAVRTDLRTGEARYKKYKSKCETLKAKEPKDRNALRRADSNCDKQAAATRASRQVVKTELPKLKRDFKQQKVKYGTDYKKYYGAYRTTRRKVKRLEHDRNHEWTSVMEIKCLLANYRDGGSFDNAAKSKCSRQTQQGRDYFGRTHKAELKLSYPTRVRRLRWSLGSFDDLTDTSAYQNDCSKTENIPAAPQCPASKKPKPVCKHHSLKAQKAKAPKKAPSKPCAKAAPYTYFSDQRTDPQHGDTCFKPGGPFKGGGDWRCPTGCTKVLYAPWCGKAGSTHTPCRLIGFVCIYSA